MVTPSEMAPSPWALPFSAHLLNNALGACCILGIVLGQGFFFYFLFFLTLFPGNFRLTKKLQNSSKNYYKEFHRLVSPDVNITTVTYQNQGINTSIMTSNPQTSFRFHQLSH